MSDSGRQPGDCKHGRPQTTCFDCLQTRCDEYYAALTESAIEKDKLRAAIKKIGFSVMRTSGEWSIRGVRDYDKANEEAYEERVHRLNDLESLNDKLLDALIKLRGWSATEYQNNPTIDALADAAINAGLARTFPGICIPQRSRTRLPDGTVLYVKDEQIDP